MEAFIGIVGWLITLAIIIGVFILLWSIIVQLIVGVIILWGLIYLVAVIKSL